MGAGLVTLRQGHMLGRAAPPGPPRGQPHDRQHDPHPRGVGGLRRPMVCRGQNSCRVPTVLGESDQPERDRRERTYRVVQHRRAGLRGL